MNTELFPRLDHTQNRETTAPIDVWSLVDIWFLGLPPHYYEDTPGTPVEDTQKYRIEKIVEQEFSGKLPRQELAANFQKVCNTFENLTSEQKGRNFPELLRDTVFQVYQAGIDAIEDPARKEAKQVLFEKIKTKEGMLMHHLGETKESMTTMFEAMKNSVDPLHPEAFSRIITPRHAKLISLVVSETHDLFKLLGDPDAQIESDHEHLMEHFFRTYGPGMKVEGLGETDELSILTPEDAEFCARVVGFHEDIWREKLFAEKTKAAFGPLFDSSAFGSDFNNDDFENQVYRAIGLFHLGDLFGNSLVYQESSTASGDLIYKIGLTKETEPLFIQRFVDLFRRHINMPLTPDNKEVQFNWKRAKVLRPQWGLSAINAINDVLFALKINKVIDISHELLISVEQGILMALNEALADGKAGLIDLAQTQISTDLELSQIMNLTEDRAHKMLATGRAIRKVESAKSELEGRHGFRPESYLQLPEDSIIRSTRLAQDSNAAPTDQK